MSCRVGRSKSSRVLATLPPAVHERLVPDRVDDVAEDVRVLGDLWLSECVAVVGFVRVAINRDHVVGFEIIDDVLELRLVHL